MGYSHPLRRGYRIVVSGGSASLGMLEGLLLHEMSHIVPACAPDTFRTIPRLTKRPSPPSPRRLCARLPQKALHDLIKQTSKTSTPTTSASRRCELRRSWRTECSSGSSRIGCTDTAVRTNDAAKDRWPTRGLWPTTPGRSRRWSGTDPRYGGAAAAGNARLLGALVGRLTAFPIFSGGLLAGLREDVTTGGFQGRNGPTSAVS